MKPRLVLICLALTAIALPFALPARSYVPAEVTFIVAANGQLLGKQLTSSSYWPQVNEAAISAVANAAPFASLPPGIRYATFIASFSDSECTIRPAEAPSSMVPGDWTKPMFDCACLQAQSRRIEKNWYPGCNLSGQHAAISFQIDEAGNPQSIKFFRATGISTVDNAALKAIESTKFEPSPLSSDAELIWDAHWPPRIISIRFRFEGECPLLPVATETRSGRPDCFHSYTSLNNLAVQKLLQGNIAEARTALEQAHTNNPDYFPAIYNLQLLHKSAAQQGKSIP